VTSNEYKLGILTLNYIRMRRKKMNSTLCGAQKRLDINGHNGVGKKWGLLIQITL